MKVPQTRIELVREYKSRRILSPVRLPVPPLRHIHFFMINTKWMEKDSNLRRRCQQIYSLPPLATRESIHINGTYRARTYDPLLVRQMLSQLS